MTGGLSRVEQFKFTGWREKLELDNPPWKSARINTGCGTNAQGLGEQSVREMGQAKTTANPHCKECQNWRNALDRAMAWCEVLKILPHIACETIIMEKQHRKPSLL